MTNSGIFENIELWLRISYLLIYFPMLIGMIKLKRLSFLQKRILSLVILTFLSDSLTFLLRINGWPNLWVFHFFVPLLVLSVMRVYNLTVSFFKSYISQLFVVVFIVFSLVNSLCFQSTKMFNSNAIVFASLIFIGMAIIYFYQLISKAREEHLEKEPMVWFNTGILLHYSGITMLFLFVNYVFEQSTQMVMYSWVLNMIFTAILIAFYTISLWVNHRR